jgi:hypothetical protein
MMLVLAEAAEASRKHVAKQNAKKEMRRGDAI